MKTRTPKAAAAPSRVIELRGVRVHNLRDIDVDIPLNQLVVVCGPCGSGKSSLAFDTVFTEGQRRFIESFSASARQSLERIERPDADRIAHVPPAVAIHSEATRGLARESVASLTELDSTLKSLFVRIGRVICPACQVETHVHTPRDVVAFVERQPAGTRLQLCVVLSEFADRSLIGTAAQWQARGYARAIVDGQTLELSSIPAEDWPAARVIADRFVAGKTNAERIAESAENAFREGAGRCLLLAETSPTAETVSETIDNRAWSRHRFSRHWECSTCQRKLAPPEPLLFDPGTGRGCPDCRENRSAPCATCLGSRLTSEALAVRIDGQNLAELLALSCASLAERIDSWELSDADRQMSELPRQDLRSRLDWIVRLHLGHLNLNRTVSTLSGGQTRRLKLAAALGARLTGTLCVIDEPAGGLESREIPAVLEALRALITLRNSLLVIDHVPEVIAQADTVIELGPGAGPAGGTVVFTGSPDTRPERPLDAPARSRHEASGWITLSNVTARTIQNQGLQIPLGQFVVVTGPSGSGKSTWILDVLVPALRHRRNPAEPAPAFPATLEGGDGLAEISVVDRSPLTRSLRSNAATWIGVFDDIREVFSLTNEARQRGFGPQHFSFNMAQGGQCRACRGTGVLRHDMQFLPDIQLLCPECGGTRYRREVLEIKYRGRSIAEVLAMTAGDAAAFFRTHPRLSGRLQMLKQIGLEYLVLGQSTETLSGGEAQRLKLAACLAARQGPSLIVCEEATAGLHPSDVVRLIACFDELISIGHTVVVIDNSSLLQQAADTVLRVEQGVVQTVLPP